MDCINHQNNNVCVCLRLPNDFEFKFWIQKKQESQTVKIMNNFFVLVDDSIWSIGVISVTLIQFILFIYLIDDDDGHP
ncbi:hypothetical protein DERP_003096 [Dermatophagoides pteronyssinus]|uniref:Uncharacterized protein n=1 Tax=Dermatophagoides pteronyssinus TaxID=6956 RepID=A0ABQ8JII6_DERPT|nr:hypothetical protein DERP_003096 [Dermatophagoides pteronyssinus]